MGKGKGKGRGRGRGRGIKLISIEQEGAVLKIILNRPEKLNALNLEMILAISSALDRAEGDAGIDLVEFSSNCEGVFSSGADIRVFVEDRRAALMLLSSEYELNRRLFLFPKKTRAIIDGLVMGGGVGIAFYTKEIIVTKRFRFAMPEVKIGFFPDVGMSYALPRLKHKMGWYLAMTGNTIGAADAAFCGLISNGDYGAGQLDVQTIESDFTHLSVDQIREKYAPDACPQSMQVAYELMKWGESQSSPLNALSLDLKLAEWFLTCPDLVEGVTCKILDKKRKPNWAPGRVGLVAETLKSLVQG